MTKEQFQKQYGREYKTFIESPCGQASLNLLAALSPPYEFSEHAHLYADNRGKKLGYETCLRNMIILSIQQTPTTEIPADYGVPDAPKETK